MDPTRPSAPSEVDLTRVTRACAEDRHENCIGRVRTFDPRGPTHVYCECPVCQHRERRRAKQVWPKPLRQMFRETIEAHPEADADEMAGQLERALRNYRRRLFDARTRGEQAPTGRENTR